MRWELRRALPLLLATLSLALLPSNLNAPHGERNGPGQATFRVNDALEESFLGWEQPPNPNSTHHLIFNSVIGLLQRWSNTHRRNGHSMVPATIPTGTILYHGRNDDQVPDVPEWLAFDFEHSYVYCTGPCYMISLQAKRDLRLLYFDGNSAAKMKHGPTNSQEVVIWGKPHPEKDIIDYERIKLLCDWGTPLGLDGFIRMEFHFEVMLCDFSNGVEVITLLDLLPKNQTKPFIRPHGPQHPPIPVPPPTKPPTGWRGSLQKDTVTFFQAYVAGGWHDRAPGETRVHLDYTGLITFYDSALSSLVEARVGKDRLHHNLEGISSADSERVHAELRSVLTRKRRSRSGVVDWASIARIVTERYADRLENLRFSLSPNAGATFADAAEKVAVVRGQLLVMLVPYITTDDVPQQPLVPTSANAIWAAPVMHRCSTTQTSGIPVGLLTPQEVRIHAAVEGTLREICRRLVLVWMEFFDVEGKSEAEAAEAIEVGRRHVDELTSWLGWSVWLRCEPACSFNEICYLPSWPFFRGEDPYDMTPHCVPPWDMYRY